MMHAVARVIYVPTLMRLVEDTGCTFELCMSSNVATKET